MTLPKRAGQSELAAVTGIKPKRRRRMRPVQHGLAYRQIWRIVDGAIRDALVMHPDFLTAYGKHGDTARRSIAKRVTGALLGYVEQSTQGRSGEIAPAADRDMPLNHGGSHEEPCTRGSSPARISPAAGGHLARGCPPVTEACGACCAMFYSSVKMSRNLPVWFLERCDPRCSFTLKLTI